jgi:hypothetical protein
MEQFIAGQMIKEGLRNNADHGTADPGTTDDRGTN